MLLITEVNVPNSVESIEVGAFKGCNAIEKITLPFVGQSESATDYTSVFGYIFGSKQISSGSTPANVTYEKMSGKSGYTTQYPMKTSSTYSKIYAYYIPVTLREVTITTQVNIPSCAFQNCDLIETITIPEKVESIGSHAFYNCSGLTRLNSETDGEFNIPKAVTNISDYMFYGCSQAVEFTMGSIETIGSHAFYNCSLVEYFNSETQYKIEVPNTVINIGV